MLERGPPSYEPANKASPAPIPIGVVVANDIIIDGRRIRELVGSVAIRVPNERPSNNWWNVTAVSREAMGYSLQGKLRVGVWAHSLNSGPDVIDNVRPMTKEWIIIPTCRTYSIL